MHPRIFSVAITLTVLFLLACGGESGGNLPSATDGCPSTGVRACGDIETGGKAVLICSKSKKWEVEEQCSGECTVDAVAGPVCSDVVIKASDPCDQPGEEACGVTTDGFQAVVVCSAEGLWGILQACQEQCDPAGPACTDSPDPLDLIPEGIVEDVVSDTGMPDPDIVEEIEEVVFKDLMPDFTPPWVESTSPEDGQSEVPVPGGEEKLVIKVVFTEPIFEPTIGSSTINVTDAGGTELPLLFAFEDEEHTAVLITIDGAVFPSSPYTVELRPDIRDLAGNSMGNTYKFSFFTASIPTLNHYGQLAGKYAPLLHGETFADAPHYDYPTRFDLDGDWVAFNNVDYIKASALKIEPNVYFSVTETQSHYFIFYIFYYPFRYAESESARFGNDVSGSMVVVRKSDQAPVAVETYYKMQEWDERSVSYITTESGFIPAGETPTSMKFDGMLDASVLFPNGHYVAYLSARKHESCLWLDENNSYLDGCQLNAGIKASMSYVEFKYKGGAVTELSKVGGKFPAVASDVGYGLIHLLDSWWPRRSEVGADKMWENTYSYEPHTTGFPNRPKHNAPLPSLFVDPTGNDNGRPPWAWRHYPQNGASFYDMPRGVVFMDPAVHFQQRHDQKYPHEWEAWDGENGYSTEYCFNPYFNLDFRGLWPECSQPE